LEISVGKIKKRKRGIGIQAKKKDKSPERITEEKPKRYSYYINVITILVNQKLKTSASFRAVILSYLITSAEYTLKRGIPTYTTLLNWVHKIGYYQLTKEKDKAEDWIIILDESIQLGTDKALVIFGIRESHIKFDRPLEFIDLIPLRIKSKQKWDGEVIKEILDELKEELGGIKYAVGDYGSDIKRGLAMAKIPHIHDITHKIALILEGLYKNDDGYKGLTAKMSEMRIKLSQSEIAYVIPPKQRKKSRYQNIKTISDWGKKAVGFLNNGNSLDIKANNVLEWIKEYEPFIEELSDLNNVIKNIEKEVKSNGLSELTIEKSNKYLSRLESPNGIKFRESINEYFKNTNGLFPELKKKLCTSDIIESAFGKYKNYVSNNPMAGVTNLVLCIAAFTLSLKKEEIKEALEATRMKDIKKWTLENIGKTLFQKRREAFSFG
jgi:hypothetical protein